MMKIAVISNGKTAEAPAVAAEVCRWLEARGVQVCLTEKPGDLPAPQQIAHAVQDCALAIAVGGDGTIVHTAKAAATVGRPVLGINGGHLGFLAGLERDGLEKMAGLLTGDFVTEERLLLEIAVCRGETRRVYYAMNEAVISRGALSRLVELQLESAGREILSCRADGVIVATPTGSTAYSFSAGGPVVDPAVDCVLVTPVCPHTVTPRSQLLPASAELTVRVTAATPEAFVTVDGEENAAFSPEDFIEIRRAAYPARLIRLTDRTFYENIQDKIMGRRSL